MVFRTMRRLAIALTAVLAMLVASTALANAGGQTLRAGAGVSAQKISGAMTQAPGAPVLCEVSAGNGVTAADGLISVTFAVACRWTDDNELASDVAILSMGAGITRDGQVFGTPRSCSTNRPSHTCSVAYPFTSPPVGTYRGIVGVEVFLSNGAWARGVFETVNSIIVT